MLQRIINLLFSNPVIFEKVRLFLDNGFLGAQEVVLRELDVHKETLDIACGTGTFSPLFDADKYIGLDMSAKYINYAREKYKRRFMVANAQNIALPDESFDNIIIVGSLHHMPDGEIQKILAETKRLLRAKGTLLIIEDLPVSRKLNFVGKLVQRLDVGKDIRTQADYETLFESQFTIKKSYAGHSGINEFCAFVLTK